MNKFSITNCFVFSNLIFGLLSIIATYEKNYKVACLFILFAAFIDIYFNKLCHLLKISFDTNKESIYLLKVVAFGIAPSVLIFSLNTLSNSTFSNYILVILYTVAVSYNLVKYKSSIVTITSSLLALYFLVTLNDGPNIIFLNVLLLAFLYIIIGDIKIKKN